MEIYLFGCKDTSLHVLRFLKKQNITVHVITIGEDLAKKNDVAGYLNLSEYKNVYNSIYVAKSYNLKHEDDIDYFNNLANCELGFCVGWQRLIPGHVLDKFKFGIHGMHGSARDLPYGKGRSPMNWAIIEDKKFFYTNLFKYETGVDNGPIVDRSVFSIKNNDTAESLHFKNVLSMCHLIQKNLPSLSEGKVRYREQNLENGETFYPKRNPDDGKIDWRDDIHNIERLVRSVSPPFYGATAFLDKKEIRIYNSQIFYTDVEEHPFRQNKIGEILDIFPNKKFLVRCSNGVLLINEYDGCNPIEGKLFEEQESPFTRFLRNQYGNFDID